MRRTWQRSLGGESEARWCIIYDTDDRGGDTEVHRGFLCWHANCSLSHSLFLCLASNRLVSVFICFSYFSPHETQFFHKNMGRGGCISGNGFDPILPGTLL